MAKVRKGADIVIRDWMQVKPHETVMVLTNLEHQAETAELLIAVEALGAKGLLYVIPEEYVQDGAYFNSLDEFFDQADVLIGATHFSIVTTSAVQKEVRDGVRFLSLPLATNDGRSLLECDLMRMDPDAAEDMAKRLLRHINHAHTLRITTRLGTDITCKKKARLGSYFNGRVEAGRTYASASFEVYVPIEEDETEGEGFVDGSLGYLGVPEAPVHIVFEGGKVIKFESSVDGKRLQKYMKGFDDSQLFYAAEFGIGLNTFASCVGNSYIEDESAYGTCHIGFGRNTALGGEKEAKGHFDVVFDKPDIYAGETLLMKEGKIVC